MVGIKRLESRVNPRERYTPPAGAIEILPSDAVRIPAIVAAAPEGAAFYLRAGEYRGVPTITPKAGQKFYGEIGQNGSRLVTFLGSTVLQGWSFADGLWSCAVSAPSVFEPHGSFRPGYAGNGMLRPLYLNGRFLQRKLTAADLRSAGSGWWAWDYAAGRIYTVDDPTGKVIELGTSQYPFRYSSGIDRVELYGLTFLRYGNHAQMGVLGGQFPAARDWVVEYCEVSWCKGLGINAGTGWKIRHCVVNCNGFSGIGSGSNVRRSGVEVIGCEMGWNNQLNFNEDWDAGAGKFSTTDGLILRGNFAHDNDGRGLWTDIDNENVLYEDNVCCRNLNEGIMHEISQRATIRNNLCGLNGRPNNWAYSPQILISASGPATVEGNLCEVAAGYGLAISVIQQNRGISGRTGQRHRSTNAAIVGNQIVYRGTAARSSGLQPAVVFASDTQLDPRPEETARIQDNLHIIEPGATQSRIYWLNSIRTPTQLQALNPPVAVGDHFEVGVPQIRYDYGWVDGYLQPLWSDPVTEDLQRKVSQLELVVRQLQEDKATLQRLNQEQVLVIDQLNQQLTLANGELSSVRSSLAAANTSIANAEATLAQRAIELGNAREQIVALQGRIDGFEAFLRQLKQLLSSI